MTALAYLALCGWIAALVAQPFGRERHLVAVAAFCAAFLLAFHFLGLVELLTGARLITTGNAALVLLAVALVIRLIPVAAGAPASMPPPPHGYQQGAVTIGETIARPTSAPGLGMHPAGPWHARLLAAVAGLADTGERRSTVALLGIATFALAGLMLVCGRPQGYEVMAYHLPLSVHLLQTHSLQAWDGSFPHTFPANASLLWAVLLERLPERLVSAANLLLLAPLVMATYALCRLADADRKASLYACCGLLGVPMIAFSSAELGADVGGIAFATLAMYFVLSPLRAAAAMPLAGLCAGLAFGFKSLHLLSAIAIGLVACARGGSVRGALRNAAWFSGVALLCGGFWLLRNGIAYGNPLHPVGVPLVGAWFGWLPAADFDTSLRGTTQREWVDSSWQWLVYPWTETQRHGQHFKHSSGLGAFIAASIPATAVALAAAIWRDGRGVHRVHAALLCAVLFIAAAWWLLGDRQPRYLLAALPLAMPLVAWTITQAAGRWRRVFDVALALCIVAMLGVFLSRQALQFGDRILLSKQTSRAAFYEYPQRIDSPPAGAAILNLADRSWHYPLAGESLANRVVSMPAGRRLLGLPPDLTAPRTVMLRAAPLRTAGITHVFVAGATLALDDCLQLEERASLERNPVNGVALGSPRVLYAVQYLCR